MEREEEVEQGVASSTNLSAVSVVCSKKYEETELCGSAADFLLGVAINASVGVSGDDVAVVPFLLAVDNDNTKGQCASINLPQQPIDNLPPDAALPHKRKMPKTKQKFGKGARRGGNTSSTSTSTTTTQLQQQQQQQQLLYYSSSTISNTTTIQQQQLLLLQQQLQHQPEGVGDSSTSTSTLLRNYSSNNNSSSNSSSSSSNCCIIVVVVVVVVLLLSITTTTTIQQQQQQQQQPGLAVGVDVVGELFGLAVDGLAVVLVPSGLAVGVDDIGARIVDIFGPHGNG